MSLAARARGEDPLLASLVRIAFEADAPCLVSRLDGPDRGWAWAAWPFRTRGVRGILAAARIEPVEGRAVWEQAVQTLRVCWERNDAVGDGTTTPPTWLAPDDFFVPSLKQNKRYAT